MGHLFTLVSNKPIWISVGFNIFKQFPLFSLNGHFWHLTNEELENLAAPLAQKQQQQKQHSIITAVSPEISTNVRSSFFAVFPRSCRWKEHSKTGSCFTCLWLEILQGNLAKVHIFKIIYQIFKSHFLNIPAATTETFCYFMLA